MNTDLKKDIKVIILSCRRKARIVGTMNDRDINGLVIRSTDKREMDRFYGVSEKMYKALVLKDYIYSAEEIDNETINIL